MRSFVAFLRFAVALVALAHLSAQQNAYTAPCRRWLHQTCIIDNKLFTDGGLVYEGDSFSNQTADKNTYLLWEDLTTVPPESAANSGFPVQNALPKDSNVPIVTGGVLWPDNVNKLFYLFGGSYYDTMPTSFFQLWLYDAIYHTWNATDTGQNQNQIVPTTNGAGAVDARGLAYYYGGYANNSTSAGWSGDEKMTGDLVIYNMAENSWTSTPPTTGNTPRAEGVLLYIPASDAGMLVYFGGVQETSNGTEEFLSMDQIQLYDVLSGKWYQQTAGGSSTPSMRRGFCAGATWADDFSSYNIYLYGGFDERGGGLNDVWILSLPSFQWILLFTDNMDPSPTGHGYTTCNVYSRSQMIIMGGLFPNVSLTTCDTPEQGNQHGLSLGQENFADATWYVFLPNVTTYDVPTNITAVIGGGSTGGATLKSPSAGWGDQDLAVYFTRSYTATQTPTRYIPSSTSTSAPSGGGDGTDVGAIAGGVVGGVVGLVAVLALAICCLRRRKRSRTPANNSAYVSELPAAQSPILQHYTPHDSPQHSQGSPAMQHQQDFSQSGHAWYQDSPVQQPSGTNWSPAPVVFAGPTQPAGPAPLQPPHTYYPPPPRPQHSSAGEEQETRTELPAMRTPVPLDGMMLQSKDRMM